MKTDEVQKEVKKESKNSGLTSLEITKFEKTLTQLKDFKDLSPEQIMELWKSKNSPEVDANLINFLLENKENLIKFIESNAKPKKMRHSGHYIDRKLEFSVPSENEPTLFDLIRSPTLREKIQQNQIEIKTKGIRLSPQQDKMISSFYKLLAERSETEDEKSENFYAGNEAGDLVPYGQDQKAKAAYLRISPHELYKEYLGKSHYSGKELENAKSVLHEVSEIKFLIVYDRKRKVVVGNTTETRTDRIEVFQSLIHIIEYIEGMTDAEASSLNNGKVDVREKKGNLLIALNPLLTDQISSKYVEYPTDIYQRTMITAGGHRLVTESMLALRDYMMRELSAKRYTCEINADKLPYLLKLESCIKSGKKSRLKKRIDDAFKVSKGLGIISEIKLTTGSNGQLKYTFQLNKNFE